MFHSTVVRNRVVVGSVTRRINCRVLRTSRYNIDTSEDIVWVGGLYSETNDTVLRTIDISRVFFIGILRKLGTKKALNTSQEFPMALGSGAGKFDVVGNDACDVWAESTSGCSAKASVGGALLGSGVSTVWLSNMD